MKLWIFIENDPDCVWDELFILFIINVSVACGCTRCHFVILVHPSLPGTRCLWRLVTV